MADSASTKSEAPGERQQEWQAYECAHEHRFAIAPANLTVGRVVKCAVCGTITVKALEGDSGVVVPKAEAESLVWEMGKQKAAAERAREEAQRERDELLRQRAEFDTPMQRAAEEAHERAERLGEALDELVRLKDGPRDDAYRAAKDAAWDRARAALARESSPTDACTCGNGEAEEDRGAVLRCPVHGIASSPTEGECS